jgi:hypothetical protein
MNPILLAGVSTVGGVGITLFALYLWGLFRRFKHKRPSDALATKTTKETTDPIKSPVVASETSNEKSISVTVLEKSDATHKVLPTPVVSPTPLVNTPASSPVVVPTARVGSVPASSLPNADKIPDLFEIGEERLNEEGHPTQNKQ